MTPQEVCATVEGYPLPDGHRPDVAFVPISHYPGGPPCTHINLRVTGPPCTHPHAHTGEAPPVRHGAAVVINVPLHLLDVATVTGMLATAVGMVPAITTEQHRRVLARWN